MTMTINPTSNALRFGKVPAALERLHDGITVAPTSQDKATPTILELVDAFERDAQADAQHKPSRDQLFDSLQEARQLVDELCHETIADRLSTNLRDGDFGAIETVYQAIKDKPTFMLDEKSPIYAALAKAFNQLKG